MRQLLEYGANPNAQRDDGWTVLHSLVMGATDSAKLESIQFLLNSQADTEIFDAKGDSILMFAILSFREESRGILTAVLSAGADPNSSSRDDLMRPLHMAARKGLVKAAKILLEHGADPKLKTIFGLSAIDEALSQNHKELAALITRQSGR